MKRINTLIALCAVVLGGIFALVPASSAFAIDPLEQVCKAGSSANDTAVCKSKDESADKLLGTVVNTLLFVVGALAVVMIIVAGILYTISSGDAGKVAQAKNTMTYSIVGLVVAFCAYAIINWVLDLF